MDAVQVDALLFDVFGTLVDWRTSIIDELSAFGTSRGISADWAALVDDWRGAYVPSMDAVRRGERPWATLDRLHRDALDRLLAERGIELDERDRAMLAHAWHRLRPWPDTLPGLQRLRKRFILCSLSNGNLALQIDLARFASLPFDMLFASDLFGHYKPDPQTYAGAIRLLGREPANVMLVAAHNGDLRAAAALGLRTAFVARPAEYGPRQNRDFTADEGVDFAAADLIELAQALGA